MLRESLERSAREHQRYETLHRTAASMLRRRHGMRHKGMPERLARHYLEAGALELALAPLFAAAQERFESSEYPGAVGLLEQRNQVLEKLRTPASDPRWGDGMRLLAHIDLLTGRLKESLAGAERTESAAKAHGWTALLPEALWLSATVFLRRGDYDAAVERYDLARSAFKQAGDDRGLARCLLGLGDTQYRRGDLTAAELLYEEALRLFEQKRDPIGTADCLWGLGYVAMWNGHLDRADQLFERQLRAVEPTGNRVAVSAALNSLAEVKRLSSHLEEAEIGYRRAIAIDEAIGSADLAPHVINLSLVLLARGLSAEAATISDPLRGRLKESGERGQLLVVNAISMAGAGARKDWVTWDSSLLQVIALLQETGMHEGDFALTLETAGDEATRWKDTDRARVAYTLSRDQWESLGRDDKRRAVVAKMERL
jgi:tetratricopeptide (TPR) repeat protein